MADDNGTGLYWAPMVAGAGLGVYRFGKDLIDARREGGWLGPAETPMSAATAARNHAMAAGMVKGSIPGQFESLLDQMAMSGAWNAGPASEVNATIQEAARLSLSRARRINDKEIKMFSDALGGMSGPQAFDFAMRNVRQSGDVGVFYRTMQNYIGGTHMPGAAFPAEAIGGVAAQIVKPTKAQAQIVKQLIGNLENAGVGGFLGRMEASAGEGIFGVGVAAGGLRGNQAVTARIGITHPILQQRGIKNIPIDLPLTSNWVAMGRDLQNLYTVQPMLSGGKPIPFAKFYAEEMSKFLPEVVKAAAEDELFDERTLKLMREEFDTRMSRYMLWTPNVSHPGMNTINFINSRHVGVPELAGASLRESGNIYGNEMFANLYKQGYMPASSGSMMLAGKVFQPMDYRNMMYVRGELFPIERRPLNALRPFAPTPDAMAAMSGRVGSAGAFKRNMPFLATPWRKGLAESGYMAPQMMTMYAVGGPAQSALTQAAVAEEQYLLARNKMKMFESYTYATKRISLNELVGSGERGQAMVDWIKRSAAGEAVDPMRLVRGERLGYAAGIMDPVMAANFPDITEDLVSARMLGGPGNEMELMVRQKYSPTEYVKLFGELDRVTTKVAAQSTLENIMSQTGVPHLSRTMDGMTYANMLRKNRYLLWQQMTTGLAELSSQQMLQGNLGPAAKAEVKAFLNNPGEWAAANMPNEVDVVRRAIKWQTPNMSLITGALPGSSKLLPKGEWAEIQRLMAGREMMHPSGWVIGAATGYVGSSRHYMGGGGPASIEPRTIFGMLNQNFPTSQGNAMALMAGDILRSTPNYRGQISALELALRSTSGDVPQMLDVASASNMYTHELIRPQPYVMDVGVSLKALGGQSRIVVPGSDVARAFRMYKTADGTLIGTDLIYNYKRLMKAAKYAAADATNIGMLETAAAEVQKSLTTAMGQVMFGRGGGSDVQGALRSKLVGGSYLTVEAGQIAEPMTMEISAAAARAQYKDLLSRGNLSKEQVRFLGEQLKTLEAGGTVPGAVWRHPTIGPYSFQPIHMRLAQGGATQTEFFTRFPVGMKTTAYAEGIGKLPVDLSPLMGMAADFDDDRVMTKMIADAKTSDAVDEMLKARGEGSYFNKYRKFAAESTLLKELAKRGMPGMAATDMDRIIAGAQKLRLTAAETGGLSEALTQAKIAMAHYKPGAAGRFLFMSEILEQQLLSSKKLNVGQNLAQQVGTAIRNIGRGGPDARADMELLTRETRRMFGKDIERGITMTMDGVSWKAKVNIGKMWEQVAEAMTMGNEPSGVLQSYRTLVRGKVKGEVEIGKVMEMMGAARAGEGGVLMNAAMAGMVGPGSGRGVASRALSRVNEGIKWAGSKAMGWFRPVLYGAAATAGAVMLLGGPDIKPLEAPPGAARGDVYGLGGRGQQMAVNNMRAQYSGSRDLRPEMLDIPGEAGQPGTPTSMPTPSTYMTNMPALNTRIIASGMADYAPDYDSAVQALRPMLQSGGMNISYHDYRQKLTSQNISDILEEGY